MSELDSSVVDIRSSAPTSHHSASAAYGTGKQTRFDPSQLEPKAALEYLYEGNRRFVAG